MLGLVAMILTFLLNYENLELVPAPHRVPVIVVGLLVLVALFDAALDLEAEWSISALSTARVAGSACTQDLLLSEAIWHTNQFRPSQKDLYDRLRQNEDISDIKFGAFTATAQNLISFAMIVIAGVAAVAIKGL